MAENENIAYNSTNFGHKNSDRKPNIILDGWKTDIVKVIATGIVKVIATGIGDHSLRTPN